MKHVVTLGDRSWIICILLLGSVLSPTIRLHAAPGAGEEGDRQVATASAPDALRRSSMYTEYFACGRNGLARTGLGQLMICDVVEFGSNQLPAGEAVGFGQRLERDVRRLTQHGERTGRVARVHGARKLENTAALAKAVAVNELDHAVGEARFAPALGELDARQAFDPLGAGS